MALSPAEDNAPAPEREIHYEHSFAAPIERVFAAMTDGAELRQWLNGPPGWKTTRCEIDLRVGGAHLQEWTGPDGQSMAIEGEVLIVDPPHRIARSERFRMGEGEAMGGHRGEVALRTVSGGTALRVTVRYPTPEARDADLGRGVREGIAMSYTALEEHLAAEA